MNPIFSGKNALVLYPTDYGGYRKKFDPLLKHFAEVHLFNYADYSHENGIRNAERRITDLIAGKKIDLVFCSLFATDHQLSVDFLGSLRRKARVVLWFADDASYFESYDRYYAQAADAVITADYFAVWAYKRLEIPAILCQEIVITNKLDPVKIEKDIDVCFIGDVGKRGRREYIKFLKDNGINVAVYGPGSENGFLPFDRMSEYYCRSRINLNFSQIAELNWINGDDPLLNRVRQNPGRPREIALAGSFCLSEYSPSLDTMFEIGKELDVFRDKAELLKKIGYYLSDPEKREAMAAAAHERAMANYQVEIYMTRALNELAAVLKAGGGPGAGTDRIYLSDGFKVKAVNGLTFSMFIMAGRGRLKYAAGTFPLLFRYGPLIFLSGFCGGTLRALRQVFGGAGRDFLAAGPGAK